MISRLPLIGASLVFLCVLGWGALLFQGLPASDLDDWDKILLARETPWSEFTGSFLTPWSQSHNWIGQTDRYDEVHYKRIVLPMLLKLSQQWFGVNYFAMYLLTKAFFFAGCMAIVFILLTQAVPLSYALLGTITFLFVPIHYSHVFWIADSATIGYFFFFLGILLLSMLIRSPFDKQARGRFWALLAGLFVTGWVGIKTKEMMLVLSLIVFVYSLLNFKQWKTAPARWALLNLAMFVMAFQIIPITHLNSGSTQGFHFNFNTLFRLLFLNYDCGYENEVRSAFVSWDHVFPVSIARTLGIFMLWTTVFAFVFYLWRRWFKRDAGLIRFLANPVIVVCAIWCLIELPFLGMLQPDPRYFSGIMAPILILLVRLFYCVLKGASQNARIVFGILLAVSFGFNIFENAQNCISLRLMVGKKMNRFSETARRILEDVRGTKISDDLTVGKAYCSICGDTAGGETIRDLTYYVDLGFEAWNKVPLAKDNFQDFLEKAKLGYRYYATFNKLEPVEFPEIKLIGLVDGINHSSLLEQAVYAKKKKRPTVLKIFKYTS